MTDTTLNHLTSRALYPVFFTLHSGLVGTLHIDENPHKLGYKSNIG